VLDGGADPNTRSGNFEGEKGPGPGYVRRSICSKRLSKGQHRHSADADWSVLDGVHIGATWRIQLNRSCTADDDEALYQDTSIAYLTFLRDTLAIIGLSRER